MADAPPAPATGDPTPATDDPTPDPAPAPAPSPTDDVQAMRDALKKANAEARDTRLKLKELEPLAAKARQLEDAQKTDTEKLTAKLADAETKGATSEAALLRLEVALDKAPAGIEPAKLRKLAERLRGTTREELETDAAELFADFGGGKPAETTEGDPPTPTPGQPPAPRPDPSQGSRGTPPVARPTSLGAAVGAALKPKT